MRTPEEEYSLFPRKGRPGRPAALDNPDARERFLSALSLSGEVAPAAAAAGVSREVAYKHLQRDPQFAMECDLAVGKLRQEAHETLKRLAVDGIPEPIFNKDGEQVGERRKYDTRALIRFIERHDKQWRAGIDIDQKVDVKGSVDISAMPAQDKKQLRDLLLRNHIGETDEID